MRSVIASKMLNASAAVGNSGLVGPVRLGRKTFHCFVEGTGPVSGTFVIKAGNVADVNQLLTVATVTLSGTTRAADGFTIEDPWAYWYVDLTALAAGAKATCAVGE